LDDLVAADMITGNYQYDSASGTLTVSEGEMSDIKLKADLFLDSNENFNIPVSAKIVDTALISGSTVFDELIQTGTFEVEIIGTADVPTVFVDGLITGHSKIPISLGGATTDTDVALGRTLSEKIHYFIEAKEMAGMTAFQFVNSGNNAVGFEGGSNTWFLTPDDVAAAEASGGLFFASQDGWGSNSIDTPMASFELTSVATENDGDVATSTAVFNVSFWEPGPGNPNTIPPLAPIVTIGPNIGLEDTNLVMDLSAVNDPSDTTDPRISIVFFKESFPDGFKLSGAFYPNLKTGHFVARAEDVMDGRVIFVAPKNFSGNVELTFEAIAANGYFQYASSGPMTATLYFDPGSDAVAIGLPTKQGFENDPLPLALTLDTTDKDGSEKLGDFFYAKLCNRASFTTSYDEVTSGDDDAVIVGTTTSTIGYKRIPIADEGSLIVQADQYWHGNCNFEVIAYAEEKEDDEDGDNRKVTDSVFTLKILAVPTPATLSAPESVVVDEGNYVAFGADLTCARKPVDGRTAKTDTSSIDDDRRSTMAVFTAVTGQVAR